MGRLDAAVKFQAVALLMTAGACRVRALDCAAAAGLPVLRVDLV